MAKKKTAHTPGPWFAFVKGNTIAVGTGTSGKAIDRVVHWSGFDACGVDLAEQVANAKAMSAVPDFITAAKAILEGGHVVSSDDMLALRHAYRKATE